MVQKKGNTIIIMLFVVLLISIFLGTYIIISQSINKNINKLYENNCDERKIEQLAYDFYFLNLTEDEYFLKNDNLIIYKIDDNIKFFVYEFNGIINIRRKE